MMPGYAVAAAKVKRIGDCWDVSTRRRFAFWHAPGVLPPEARVELGQMIVTHPEHLDLPYLMVVDSATPAPDGGLLIRTVAHDVPPPGTLYYWPEPVEAPS